MEVKSARNVSARSLRRLMGECGAPYAVRVSENGFGRSFDEDGRELRSLPLYAAFCIGEDADPVRRWGVEASSAEEKRARWACWRRVCLQAQKP